MASLINVTIRTAAFVFAVLTFGIAAAGAQSGPQIETTITGTAVGPMMLDERRNVVYVLDPCHHSVGGVDVRDRSLTTSLGRIPTYCGPVDVFDFEMDAAAERLYVTDGELSGGFQIIDLSTRLNTGVDRHPDSVFGINMALNATTGFVYLNGWVDGSGGSGLAVLDPSKSAGDSTRFMSMTIPWDRLTYVANLAVNPTTNLVYVSSICGGGPTFNEKLGVAVVDGTPGSPTFHAVTASLSHPLAPIPTNFGLTCWSVVAVNRHTNRVYVASHQTLHVIDGNPASPTFNSFITHIPLPLASPSEVAFDVAVNPITGRVYTTTQSTVSGDTRSRLITVDEASLSVVSSIDLPFGHRWVMVDASQNRVVVNGVSAVTTRSTTILSDSVTQSASVPAGAGAVTVSSTAATMTFSEVASPGAVTLEPIEASELPLALPGQFSIEGGLTYDVSTTAGFSGAITLCFNVSHVTDPTLFATLRVLHGEGGNWVDRTTSRDYATGTICAVTNSLSPFVIGHLDVRYSIQKLYDATRAVRAGATFPLKIQLFAPTGENLSGSDIAVRAVAVRKISNAATFSVQDAGNANPDGDFRFDSSLSGGGYIYNLKTAGLSSGTYELEFVAVGDPTHHRVTFQVR